MLKLSLSSISVLLEKNILCYKITGMDGEYMVQGGWLKVCLPTSPPPKQLKHLILSTPQNKKLGSPC